MQGNTNENMETDSPNIMTLKQQNIFHQPTVVGYQKLKIEQQFSPEQHKPQY